MTTVLCFQESVHIVSRKIGNPWESVGIRAILCCKKQPNRKHPWTGVVLCMYGNPKGSVGLRVCLQMAFVL